jgi:hypothetical protein
VLVLKVLMDDLKGKAVLGKFTGELKNQVDK